MTDQVSRCWIRRWTHLFSVSSFVSIWSQADYLVCKLYLDEYQLLCTLADHDPSQRKEMVSPHHVRPHLWTRADHLVPISLLPSSILTKPESMLGTLTLSPSTSPDSMRSSRRPEDEISSSLPMSTRPSPRPSESPSSLNGRSLCVASSSFQSTPPPKSLVSELASLLT